MTRHTRNVPECSDMSNSRPPTAQIGGGCDVSGIWWPRIAYRHRGYLTRRVV